MCSYDTPCTYVHIVASHGCVSRLLPLVPAFRVGSVKHRGGDERARAGSMSLLKNARSRVRRRCAWYAVRGGVHVRLQRVKTIGVTNGCMAINRLLLCCKYREIY